MKITLLAISAEIELRIHERTIVLHCVQAEMEGSIEDGLGMEQSRKLTLFLAVKAISIDRRQVLKLSPFKVWDTSIVLGLSQLWWKNGLEAFSLEIEKE
jgi:hypothetical protein